MSLTPKSDQLLPVRRLSGDALKAWQEVLEKGFEDLVAKDPASAYVGGRTLKWLKVKQPRLSHRGARLGDETLTGPRGAVRIR
jgi:ATP-dependent DNA ligase